MSNNSAQNENLWLPKRYQWAFSSSIFLAEYARWMVAVGRLSPCCYLRFTAQKKKWVAFHQYGNVSNQIQKSVKQFSSPLGCNCLRWVYFCGDQTSYKLQSYNAPTWQALGQCALLFQVVLGYSLLLVTLDSQGHSQLLGRGFPIWESLVLSLEESLFLATCRELKMKKPAS